MSDINSLLSKLARDSRENICLRSVLYKLCPRQRSVRTVKTWERYSPSASLTLGLFCLKDDQEVHELGRTLLAVTKIRLRLSSVIVGVRVGLKTTVTSDNLSESHLQSQANSVCLLIVL